MRKKKKDGNSKHKQLVNKVKLITINIIKRVRIIKWNINIIINDWKL